MLSELTFAMPYHFNSSRPLVNRNLILPSKIMQMPDQARYHLRQPRIRLGACRRDDRIGELEIESRSLQGICSGAAIRRYAGSRLVRHQGQWLVDVHRRRRYARLNGQAIFVCRRLEEEVLEGAEDEEEGV
jgi:hypothetical protein